MGLFDGLIKKKNKSVAPAVASEPPYATAAAIESETKVFTKLSNEVGSEAKMMIACLNRATHYFTESGRVPVHTHND